MKMTSSFGWDSGTYIRCLNGVISYAKFYAWKREKRNEDQNGLPNFQVMMPFSVTTSPIYSSLCQWVCVRALISVSSYSDFGCLCHCHSHRFIVFFCSDIIGNDSLQMRTIFLLFRFEYHFPPSAFLWLLPRQYSVQKSIAFIIDKKKRAQRTLYSVHCTVYTQKSICYIF